MGADRVGRQKRSLDIFQVSCTGDMNDEVGWFRASWATRVFLQDSNLFSGSTISFQPF